MSALITEISALRSEHRHALQLHLLALSADDRYQRFGSTLSDAALIHWVRDISWHRSRWYGAWSSAETGLLGVLQLAPLNTQGMWEMALTVIPAARRLGVGSAMFGTLTGLTTVPPILELVCQNGHPAIRRMAEYSKLKMRLHSDEPKMRMSFPG